MLKWQFAFEVHELAIIFSCTMSVKSTSMYPTSQSSLTHLAYKSIQAATHTTKNSIRFEVTKRINERVNKCWTIHRISIAISVIIKCDFAGRSGQFNLTWSVIETILISLILLLPELHTKQASGRNRTRIKHLPCETSNPIRQSGHQWSSSFQERLRMKKPRQFWISYTNTECYEKFLL